MAMHDDQIPSDVDVIRGLIRQQCPQWADLPVVPVASTGTDNAMYRIGDELVARLPLRPSSIGAIDREHRWLPRLAPRLPLTIPVPRHRGTRTGRFPWPWSVYPWLPGADAATADVDLELAAHDLARFVVQLQRIDTTGGPPARPPGGRGVPLAARDELTRLAIDDAAHLVDVAAVTTEWERALAAPPWTDAPVWLHGDLASGNLLVSDRRVSAVIDFGAVAVGDPACDAQIAWEMFEGDARRRFRDALAIDDHAWDRARGWALSTALLAFPYYEHSNRFMADQASLKIAAVLADA